jgi:hypothetical protein
MGRTRYVCRPAGAPDFAVSRQGGAAVLDVRRAWWPGGDGLVGRRVRQSAQHNSTLAEISDGTCHFGDGPAQSIVRSPDDAVAEVGHAWGLEHADELELGRARLEAV